MKDLIIGIDLGGTTTKSAIIKTNGELLHQWTIETNTEQNGKQIIPTIIASIKQTIVEQQIAMARILGIGMGSPGAVDRSNGTVSGAYNLHWHHTEPINEQFAQAFACPFFLENDANAAALGEKWKGSGEDQANVVFLTLGTGVGGGMIVNHELVVGRHGCAGEIGHLHVTDDEEFQCTCGNQGCLESIASATGLVHLMKKLAETFKEESSLKEKVRSHQQVSVKEIFDAAKEQDVFAVHVVTEFSYYIGLACAHITNTLDPDKIILGGGIAAAGQVLLDHVRLSCERFVFPKARNKERLTLANLGNTARVLGAAYLVLSKQKG